MKLEEYFNFSIKSLLVKFADIREQLYLKTSHVENFVDELRNILTPAQTAKFLIGLERVFIIMNIRINTGVK